MMIDIEKKHLLRFYGHMQDLRHGLGGGRILGECDGRLDWPKRGVYFLSESGEICEFEPTIPRIVRVGTHAVSTGSKSTLWGRLRAHRGNSNGVGNHRGSILRLHVGMALMALDHELQFPSWGRGSSASKEIRAAEEPLERLVSEYVGRMSVIWIKVEDEPGVESDRAYLERNAIGLLSGPGVSLSPYGREWLGNHSPKKTIRESGVWNINHVGYGYDPRFLDVLERYVESTTG